MWLGAATATSPCFHAPSVYAAAREHLPCQLTGEPSLFRVPTTTRRSVVLAPAARSRHRMLLLHRDFGESNGDGKNIWVECPKGEMMMTLAPLEAKQEDGKKAFLVGYGYHITNSSRLNLSRTHHIPCLIRKQPSNIGGVPDKERQPEFYMETIRTTRIVSILVFLVLLGQGDTYGYKYNAP
uniref:Uncharacterized protein n=1 Tax=Oryza sativa subsp. japonica TaxID=39947 RepID=Q10FL3_ORYSJ|nr:hypothetical protein LOC_Os03g46134 [Oryza sativa Japonica Group]